MTAQQHIIIHDTEPVHKISAEKNIILPSNKKILEAILIYKALQIGFIKLKEYFVKNFFILVNNDYFSGLFAAYFKDY